MREIVWCRHRCEFIPLDHAAEHCEDFDREAGQCRRRSCREANRRLQRFLLRGQRPSFLRRPAAGQRRGATGQRRSAAKLHIPASYRSRPPPIEGSSESALTWPVTDSPRPGMGTPSALAPGRADHGQPNASVWEAGLELSADADDLRDAAAHPSFAVDDGTALVQPTGEGIDFDPDELRYELTVPAEDVPSADVAVDPLPEEADRVVLDEIATPPGVPSDGMMMDPQSTDPLADPGDPGLGAAGLERNSGFGLGGA